LRLASALIGWTLYHISVTKHLFRLPFGLVKTVATCYNQDLAGTMICQLIVAPGSE
jgi:hypothetical protein